MGELYFYQLMRSPLETALPQLLHRALGNGWRVIVRGRTRDLLQRLDEQLWIGDETGFLPHGLAGNRHDPDQPVLLTDQLDLGAGRDCMMALEGTNVEIDEVQALKRVCILFDGNDGDALTGARVQWKELTKAGLGAQFWSDENGRWEKKSERPPR